MVNRQINQKRVSQASFWKNNKEKTKFIESIKATWKDFHPLITEIPKKGYSYNQCLRIIKQYSQMTLEKIKNNHYSGTIYQAKLLHDYEELELQPSLESLYMEIFRRSYLWNSLHDHEFPVANIINYQIVSMIAELFGGDKNTVMGLVTTGGTQSLMNTARSYVNYGVMIKKLDSHDCVIIAPNTIHPAIMKAQDAYHFKLILIKTNIHGTCDIQDLQAKVKYHKRNLIALFCSVPSYPYGTIDNIEIFSSLASKYQVGLHVDCCLGGFIVNFMETDILKFPGVTSLSVDTHKNGQAPKGSSVLIYKQLGEQNMLYYSIYAVTNSLCGIYGSPKDEGSQSCTESFCALITLLYYGKERYIDIATNICQTVSNIKDFLSTFPAVQIINPQTSVNIIAFKIDNIEGATYRLSDIMGTKGFVFNTLTNNIIHFCVTDRFAYDNVNNQNFKKCFEESYQQLMSEIVDGKEFDGSARMYCSINKALRPKVENKNYTKYIENSLFGELGVRDAIRNHFLALNNPYYQ